MGNHIKSMLSAAVLITDLIAGFAARPMFQALHHPHSHPSGVYALYAVLGVATLAVIRYVVTPARTARASRPYIPGGPR